MDDRLFERYMDYMFKQVHVSFFIGTFIPFVLSLFFNEITTGIMQLVFINLLYVLVCVIYRGYLFMSPKGYLKVYPEAIQILKELKIGSREITELASKTGLDEKEVAFHINSFNNYGIGIEIK